MKAPVTTKEWAQWGANIGEAIHEGFETGTCPIMKVLDPVITELIGLREYKADRERGLDNLVAAGMETAEPLRPYEFVDSEAEALGKLVRDLPKGCTLSRGKNGRFGFSNSNTQMGFGGAKAEELLMALTETVQCSRGLCPGCDCPARKAS